MLIVLVPPASDSNVMTLDRESEVPSQPRTRVLVPLASGSNPTAREIDLRFVPVRRARLVSDTLVFEPDPVRRQRQECLIEVATAMFLSERIPEPLAMPVTAVPNPASCMLENVWCLWNTGAQVSLILT
jgi:hypothetical protein